MGGAPVLIVGGGPAGAITALQLARRGIACQVLETSDAFRVKTGETLPPNAEPLLQRLGLRALLDDDRHLPSHGNQFVWGSGQVQERNFFGYTNQQGWHLDRALFEAQLAEIAQRAGAIWRMGCTVREVVPGPSWTVRVTHQGRVENLSARFVVDATGRGAHVAKAQGSERVQLDGLIGLASCVDLDREIPLMTRIEAVREGWWYAAPIAGQKLVTVYFTDPHLLDKSWRDGVAYAEALRSVGSFKEILPKGALQLSSPQVRLASSSYLSRVYGTAWLAVGDAAFAYDPISSYGITAALGSGFYAGNAIADHLAGNEVALPAYAHLQSEVYANYLSMRDHQYRQEQRWPEASFWAVRTERQAMIGASI